MTLAKLGVTDRGVSTYRLERQRDEGENPSTLPSSTTSFNFSF